MVQDGKQERVSIVFGGSSGIGAAVAQRLSRDGSRVAVVGSRPAARVNDLMEQLPGGLYIQRDLSLPDSARQATDAVIEKWGRLDAVVYSAATTLRVPHSDLDAVTDEVWERILGMNVISPWRVIQATAPKLRESGDGTFTVIGALAGADVGGSSIPYAVSKAAVHHMCKLLGGALGPNIRVNAVAPGFIETPWTEGWDQLRDMITNKAPLKRVGTPSDVADVVAMLIASRYVTGQTVVADGGLSLIP